MSRPGTADFTEAGLLALLSEFRAAGYHTVFFDAAGSPGGELLLRHDVDVDLDAAVQVAELEQDVGVRATYFLLLTSPLYNLLSGAGREAVQRITDAGHEVGLHFDASARGLTQAELGRQLLAERSILSDLIGKQVTIYSLHKPATNTNAVLSGSPDLSSAYDQRFFGGISYSSDSMGWWRFGRPTETEAFGTRRSMQLVLHPVWWTSTDPEHPTTRLERLIDEITRRTTDSLASTVGPYGAALGLTVAVDDGWSWPDGLRGGPNG